MAQNYIMTKNYIDEIEKAGKVYALTKNIYDGSEKEIVIHNMNGRICIYCESPGSAEFVTDICSVDDVTKDEIITLCNKRHWSYCL